MTNSQPGVIQQLTPHIVVRDAAAAAAWYLKAFDAREVDRLPLPNGKLMYAELHFGESAVRVADEFPEFGILSPLALSGTATVLHLTTSDVRSSWQQAIAAGAKE